MFIFKKHISRRTVLKGAGVTLALPFLEAMVPAATALAQTAANPKIRAGFFYLPHGAVQHDTKFGADFNYLPLDATFTVNYGGVYDFGTFDASNFFPGYPHEADLSAVQAYGAGLPATFVQGLGSVTRQW